MSYIVGQVVVFTGTFRDADGDLVDPTVVTLYVQTPDLAEAPYVYNTDPGMIRDSVGVYHKDYELLTKGVYFWRWDADGSGEGADEGYIFVKRSQFVLP